MIANSSSSQIIFWKNSFCHKICTHFPNLVFCVCLFVGLSVCLCLWKYPASGGQTKFWSKVLEPVLASEDTVLEIFNFNDFNFSVFFEPPKLLSIFQKLHQKALFLSFCTLVRLFVWEPNGWPFCSAEYKKFISWAKLVKLCPHLDLKLIKMKNIFLSKNILS